MRNAKLVGLLLSSGCAMNPPLGYAPTDARIVDDRPQREAEAGWTAVPETAAPAPKSVKISYPAARRMSLVEPQFGVQVADPYRWLEGDVRTDAEVKVWVEAENGVTQAFLAELPWRAAFKARMTELFDYERFGIPLKKGGYYFTTRNGGLQNQSVLFVRDSFDGPARQLIDPNIWSADGATALAEWQPSEDGAKLVYAVQDGGTDWRTLRVLDVASGKIARDEIKWAKFSEISWAKDGSGFYYSRFPAPTGGAVYQSLANDHAVYFHHLGTPQSVDRKLYATPARPKLLHDAQVSDDGRWLVVTSAEAGDNVEIALVDLTRPAARPRILIPGFVHSYAYIGNRGSDFYFVTDKGAPKRKVEVIDIASAKATRRTLIGEDQATLDSASLVGGKLIASYLKDAKTEVRVANLDGRIERIIALPGIGTASGFAGRYDDPETFFAFTSFNRPTTIYRYDAASGDARPWASPKVGFNPDDFTVEQRFYASKDGTKVPMFIVRKAGTHGPAPTILYAYGGFNVPTVPDFSPTRLAWIEAGGVYAVANIRGGSEYGKAWHDAGRLANKQNVFDDFIAAGENLKAWGVTGANQLAVEGASNGGLLIGAVVDQRPDLFAAAHPAVGVMDMLRFDRFTAGRYWVDDYGHPDQAADFHALFAYSPYHNIKPGVRYPPLIATTADTDDRVVPGHSFKYIAAMQAADPAGAPHLIRIETRAGHGSGKPTTKIIEESSDVYAFLAKYTGLAPPELARSK